MVEHLGEGARLEQHAPAGEVEVLSELGRLAEGLSGTKSSLGTVSWAAIMGNFVTSDGRTGVSTMAVRRLFITATTVRLRLWLQDWRDSVCIAALDRAN